MKSQQKAVYLAALAVLFWSTVATAFKLGLRCYSPLQLIFLSSFVSVFVFLGISVVTGRIRQIFRQDIGQLLMSAVLGLLSPAAYYLVLFMAYQRLPAQVAQPLNYVWTIVLVLLSVPFLGQKLSFVKFLSVLIGFSGAFIISTQGKLLNFRLNEPIGVGLALGSSVLWAMYWIFSARDGRDDVVKLLTNFVFGVIYLTVLMFWFKAFDGLKSGLCLLAPVYIGFFEMGFTFYLWMRAMELTDSSAKISNLVFFSPFLSLVFIHFVLGEQLYYTTFLGLLLIILGIWLSERF